jgi:hypothetical protein
VARQWGNVARRAAASAGYWFVLGLITFLGMNAVIKVEATRTRLFLVVVVIGGAFLAASLLEQLLRRGEPPREDWPRWYSRFNHPMLYRSTADAPYSYVVLPQRLFPDWLSKPRRRSATKLLSKDEAHQIAATIPKLPELFAGGLVVFVPTRRRFRVNTTAPIVTRMAITGHMAGINIDLL